MPPRFLIACDKFKGSLSAPEACAAIARGVTRVFPGAECDLCPIADGGEGFVHALLSATGGVEVEAPALDALGRPVRAGYGLVDDNGGKVAVLEMAAAAGLWRLAENEKDILRANTAGVGMLLRHAAETSGAREIILGIGGSATNDGGTGMLHALGARFFDAAGRELAAHPAGLQTLDRIDLSGLAALPPITVACDVTNPLLGDRGATRVFGPQKGATPELTPILENFLARLVAASGGQINAEASGAGAAGGLGFALRHFLDADLKTGFDIVARTVNLAARIARADIVVTGEGSLDIQSLAGKGPAGVALQALLAAKPIVALVGRADADVRMSGLFLHIAAVLDRGHSIADCMRDGAALLEEEAARVPWGEWL